MYKGQYFSRNERLVSENGRFKFEISSSGQLQLTLNGVIYWFLDEVSPVDRVSMEIDGNLVVNDKQGVVLFSTNTNTGEYLILENDGNLVVRDSNQNKLWSSETTHCKI